LVAAFAVEVVLVVVWNADLDDVPEPLFSIGKDVPSVNRLDLRDGLDDAHGGTRIMVGLADFSGHALQLLEGPFAGDRAGGSGQIPGRAPGQEIGQIEELPCCLEDAGSVLEEP
jgi:hypothetical protein